MNTATPLDSCAATCPPADPGPAVGGGSTRDGADDVQLARVAVQALSNSNDSGDLADLADLAAVFGMLADPGRLRLLVALLGHTELCVCDLSRLAGLSESATSHALRLLRAHRIVRVRRAGRKAHYRLEDEHVRQVLCLALTHQQHTGGGAATVGDLARAETAAR